MNMRQLYKPSILIIIGLVLAVSSHVWARSLNDIKQSMIDRAPTIKQLKSQGIVGENNSGYLEFVGSAKPQADVVAQENTDRKAIYSYFARQQNTTLAVVESVQAKRKAKQADPGEYVQNPDGSWAKR